MGFGCSLPVKIFSFSFSLFSSTNFLVTDMDSFVALALETWAKIPPDVDVIFNNGN